MSNYVYIFLISLSAMLTYSCKTEVKNERIDTKEITFNKEGELSLFNFKDTIVDPIVDLNIEIADNEYQIQTGLMYRKTMKDDQGMLFIFPEEAPRSFYMKNTEFALDIIFIDANYKVVSIQKNAQPLNETSLPSEGPAQYVLEVNAGLSEQWNLKPGDSISFIKL
ncbi:DUF192 domain-containing protein [Aquimarina sp. U1-2]|uniref:DUF192 domain-containing protein n=1 Tax=Aquimarina sp. U1-2 TaxID=2823141 RepID=UPI001AECF9A2|nr:DUF192 domain-containing protein [Aquimarina sp. U1-2]MBP2832189.1 DUF192 domain-containing protein [Aquimarina sp. U1-2]